MKISIIGAGYVGLVTGVCLAAKGHQVICVDQKRDIVDMINNMKTPIYEPGLDGLLRQVVASGNLVATNDLYSSVSASELSMITVGTPCNDCGINLCYIEQAAREIGMVLREKDEYHIVCVKSTVVPTTTDTFVKKVLVDASGKDPAEFGLAMNPEFLREGSAVEDFLHPDRIVIGADDERSFFGMKKVYEAFPNVPVIRVNLRTAEMIKYIANTLLATLISYANEAASICETVGGIDIKDVLAAVMLDNRFSPRIGDELIVPQMIKYLEAGCGFGGSCFPKDVKALVAFSAAQGYLPQMMTSTLQINKKQPLRLLERLEAKLGTLENRKITIMGLSFKPDTDDVRESPSIAIINALLERNATVYGLDPVATENMERVMPRIAGKLIFTTDYQLALQNADAAILVTSWPAFINIPPREYVRLMKYPLVVDGRRVLNKEALEKAGCHYLGVGYE